MPVQTVQCRSGQGRAAASWGRVVLLPCGRGEKEESKDSVHQGPRLTARFCTGSTPASSSLCLLQSSMYCVDGPFRGALASSFACTATAIAIAMAVHCCFRLSSLCTPVEREDRSMCVQRHRALVVLWAAGVSLLPLPSAHHQGSPSAASVSDCRSHSLLVLC